METVPPFYQVGVNRNRRNNLTSRIYQGAAHRLLGRWSVYRVGAR